MVEFALENNTHQPADATGQQHQPAQPSASSLTGAIPRTPARLPEDVTALATDRDTGIRDANNKNAVTKTYHTLKDLISAKFKKDSIGGADELMNNAAHQHQLQQQQQQLQQQITKTGDEDFRSPYSALPVHMRQMQGLNQSQPNIWNGTASPPGSIQEQQQLGRQTIQPGSVGGPIIAQRSYAASDLPRGVQQRAISQPQLNMPSFERRDQQSLQSQGDRCGSLANIDVTDSDEGGFATRVLRRPHTVYQTPPQHLTSQQQQISQRQSPQSFQHVNGNSYNGQQQYVSSSQYQHSHLNPAMYNASYHQQQQQQMQQELLNSQQQQSAVVHQSLYSTQPHLDVANQLQQDSASQIIQSRQDALRASFQKQMSDIQQQAQQVRPFGQDYQLQTPTAKMLAQRSDIIRHQTQGMQSNSQPSESANNKPMPGSAGSSDYDKSGNHSSNVDSGRGSAAYSSGRKMALDADSLDSPRATAINNKSDDSEWVDIVDSELRHILEPNMQNLSIRPESTVSGSVSSMSPPLPPLSPGGSSYKPIKSKDKSKQEYGTDSYNRPGRISGPIGPSRAGWPGASVQKQSNSRTPAKKNDQAMLKRHLFGLDNDMTSTTTRSLDLESILGGPWGTGQSVSDSETDTQGIRHIRNQLEGLENMYGEVLKMLGSRGPSNRMHDGPLRGPPRRRRHGSLSSLPSSSVSGRPIRDKRRSDDRRKVRDIKGINQRFQRLESHVVTLARSVAHLSSEMRSQHLVTQELERLRDDLTNLRSQASRSQQMYRSSGNDPEPPNLTNPRRVKKLTKFFGEDPPLMRLFLKNLGYEKYANLFEAERVGMIELPYLGEERLQKLGVPLGPRLRILQEAQISLCKDTTLCIV